MDELLGSEPLVSILVPVYNVEEYVERCARSVLEQTYTNLEFVFVDDGSTDNSMDILQRVIADYPDRKEKVLIIHHECNKGLPSARNTAVKACHGDFVFHVDSDDWVEKDAVELMVRKQVETGADIITARAYDNYDDRIEEHLDGGRNLDKEALLCSLLTYKVSPCMWLRLIKRSLYIDNDVWAVEGKNGAEDFQVFPRLVYYSQKHSGIDSFVYHNNRYNNNSITNGGKLSSQLGGINSIRVIISFFSDKEKHLYDLIAGHDVVAIHQRLVRSVLHKNESNYNVLLSLMKESNQQYWYKVGWDNSVKKLIDSHYFTMAFYQQLRFLFRIPLKVYYSYKNRSSKQYI